MPIDISDLVKPEHTAVVINECQVGVMGDQSVLPAIADETRWIIPNVARLVQAARTYDAAVMHTVARPRADGRGGRTGGVVSRHTRPKGPALDPDQFSAIMPEIGVAESDFIVPRFGGMGGLSSSGAVSILRALGVRTLVLGGITLNAGVFSMMIYAIDEGFDAIVVSDASGGFPRSYGDEVLQKSIRPFAPVVTVDEIVASWQRAAETR
ncbi:isochorismatase family protein [Jatrophihabitans sp. DSM 45814]